MTTKLKNTLNLIIGLLIGLGFVLIWLYFTDLHQIAQHFANINPIYLVYGGVFYLLSYVLRSSRLLTLLKSNNPNSSLGFWNNLSYVYAANMLNYLLPRAGEVGKGLFYKQNHQIGWSASLPSIIIDKIFDTFAIFAVLILLPFTGIVFSHGLKVLIIMLTILFCIGISILIITAISRKTVVFLLQKVLFFLPSGLKKKIFTFITLFVDGLANLQRKGRNILLSLVYTLLATLTDACFFYMMFLALGVSIGFLNVLLGYTLIFLSYALPHPPAQIGSNELIMMIVFSIGFGYDKNEMSAVMTTSHLFTMIIIAITGSIAFIFGGLKSINLNNKEQDYE